MDNIQGHLKLEVWTRSIDLVSELYLATKDFPKNELYGIVSQIRRAGVSIPANIAEGSARTGKKESLHFLSISIGSSSELATLLLISKKVHYLDENQYNSLSMQLNSISRMLTGLKKSIMKQLQT
jgi:four helix bundle protein